MRRLIVASVATAACLAVVGGSAYAGTPDGAAGPWADSVVNFTQGSAINGGFLPGRSDPAQALGPAESAGGNDDPVPNPPTFVSLGFGGQLTLQFQNPICAGPGNGLAIDVREITRDPYPDEKAQIYASEDGVTFFLAGTITKDGSVSLPAPLTVAHYVKLVDVSDPLAFGGIPNADGFDVDGVRALSTSCGEKLGLKGCTPGYWKQKQHFDSWPAGISPSDKFGPTFLGTPTFANMSLLSVLEQGGGGDQALGRHAVAALLNALSPNVDYPYTSAQVKTMVFNALASGNAKTIESTKDTLEKANQLGCPIN